MNNAQITYKNKVVNLEDRVVDSTDFNSLDEFGELISDLSLIVTTRAARHKLELLIKPDPKANYEIISETKN